MIKLYEFPLSRFFRKVKLVLHSLKRLTGTEGFAVPAAVTVSLVRKVEANYRRTTMRVRSLGYAALVFTAGFGFAACAQVWYMKDGPGAGREVSTCFNGPIPDRAVLPPLNPPGTVGRIADPDLCDDLHYHGILSFMPDPNPFGCGWGRVGEETKIPATANECPPFRGPLGPSPLNLFGERVAMDLMAKNPPDYENAFVAAREAVDALETWVTKVDEVQLPEHVAGQIKGELQVALFSDRSALAVLERLHTNQGQDGDGTIAVDNLRTALSAKWRVLKLLTEAGLLNVNGTANGDDEAFAVTVDTAGNVVAAGFTSNTGTLRDFTVVKFSGVDGTTELWRQEIDGTANGNDQAAAVRVDGVGDVVAAGFTTNSGTSADFTVVKFSGADGTELWRKEINGTADMFDVALAVTVDGVGDVVAAGFTINSGTSADFTVVKFSGADGTELWRQVIDGTANDFDEALAVTVDGVGDVVAAGFTQNTGTSRDFTVVKFSGVDGTELWRQVINGTADMFDAALAVTVDGAGDVVAAGFTTNTGTLRDFTVVKFSGADGTELWRQVINGTANDNDEALAVAVDAAGNVVAAGRTRNTATLGDFAVVKFSGIDGTELWRQEINGTANNNDEALAVAVDGAGDVVAAGKTWNTDTFTDFAVVKFSGVDGTELWRKVINGTANDFDEARAVRVDGAGDVVAAGFTRNTGTSNDLTVVKLRGTDGGDL